MRNIGYVVPISIQELAFRLNERVMTLTFICNISEKQIKTAGTYHVPSGSRAVEETLNCFHYPECG